MKISTAANLMGIEKTVIVADTRRPFCPSRDIRQCLETGLVVINGERNATVI